jgi:hypothetical protein
MPQKASARPALPATSESSRFSVRSCRTRRRRLAPVAARSDSSLWRATPAASSRLATFAQTDQQHEAHGSEEKRKRVSRFTEEGLVEEQHACPDAVRLFTAFLRIRRLTAVASSCAEASETPGFSFPTAIIHRACGIFRRSFAAQNAIRSSQGASAKPLGITPNHRARFTVHADGRSDDFRGSTQPPLPGVVADDDRPGFLLLDDVVEVLEPIGAPQQRLDADDRQRVDVDRHLFNPGGSARARPG